MRIAVVAWVEVLLATIAVVCTAVVGFALQQQEPAVWVAIASLLVAGRILLR